MPYFDVDLHIHSLHSIGVSKAMTIPKIAEGALVKGLHIMGTGDATQPQWLAHLERHLKQSESVLEYNSISFILTVEIEDAQSIHHLVILPNFEAVNTLRNLLNNDSPNLNHEWGGRPRVNLMGTQIAGLVRDVGGMIGPAHAFTPYRSIFREDKHSTLKTCYGDETQHVHFLELGLSADSIIADNIPELHRLTYITSSDAHSPSPGKLGREFVRFEMNTPSYDELRRALLREKGRKAILNVGLDPRLGKYYLSYCSKCRRTLILETGDMPPSYDDSKIYMNCRNQSEANQIIGDIQRRKVKCPVDGKPLRLGVRDRAAAIGVGTSESPSHRPPYLRIAPLLDIIITAIDVKSESSKTALYLYNQLRDSLGSETFILTDANIQDIEKINERLSQMITVYRDGSACYECGGGGRYGKLLPHWECENR